MNVTNKIEFILKSLTFSNVQTIRFIVRHVRLVKYIHVMVNKCVYLFKVLEKINTI